jgi:hypothetical protein
VFHITGACGLLAKRPVSGMTLHLENDRDWRKPDGRVWPNADSPLRRGRQRKRTFQGNCSLAVIDPKADFATSSGTPQIEVDYRK